MADSVGAAPGARIPILAASTRPGPVRILAAHVMKFCSQCAAPLQLRVPEGDQRPRYVCTACGTIHYQNPQAGGRLRARARRAHPAVSPRDRAAARLLDRAGGLHGERRDAAGVRRARIAGRGARRSRGSARCCPWCTCCTPNRCTSSSAPSCRRRALAPARRASRSSWSSAADIPWADIAFPSTDFTLRRYLEDRAAGREEHHFTTIDRRLARAPQG